MPKNSILLINTNLIKPPIAPIGLDYIGSALISKGFNVELLDLNFSKNIYHDIRNKLNSNHFMAIGVTIRNSDDCYFLSQDNFLEKIKNIVSYIEKYSDSPVIIGGGGFSVMPEEIIKYLKVDYGIIGDGEFNFLKLVENIKNNKIKKRHSYTLMGPSYNLLNDYPLPIRDLVDNKRYFELGGMGNIETKRGCNRGCIYCADPIIKGKKLRVRPIDKVISEIKNLLKKGIYCLHLCDSEFNIPINYATFLLQKLIDAKLGDKFRWYTYMSPVPLDDQFVGLLKKAGCRGINFGIDSADSIILKNLKRNHKPQDIKNIAEICSKHKIRFMFDLLLGGPGEDKKSIKNTIEFVKKLNPTCVGISYGIRVYPGTILYKTVRKNFLQKNNLTQKRFLYGNIENNIDFTKPIFYISDKIGTEIVEYTNTLVKKDSRFFIGATVESERNYNYNENLKLQKAIKDGYRGAYWDILQKIC